MNDTVKEALEDFARRLRDVNSDIREHEGELKELRSEAAQIDTVIAALKQANGSAAPKRKAVAKKLGQQRLSKAGREAISKAARKRWAKYRKEQKRS